MRPELDNGLTIEDAEIKRLKDTNAVLHGQLQAQREITLRLKNHIEHLETSSAIDRLYEQAQEDEIWALRDKCNALEGRPNRSKVERFGEAQKRGERVCL